MLGKQYKARLCLAVAGVLCASSVFAGTGLEASAAVNAPAVTSAGGWLESAYVTWSASEGADGYNVYVTGESGEKLLDDELIRVYSNGSGQQYYRADALGLSSGNYSFKVVPVENGKEQAGASSFSQTVYVQNHDRSGFGFVNGTSNGAYNADGTLRSDAVVLYITKDTKDSVALDVVTNAKGATTSATGLQNILNLYKKGYDKRPLDVRFVGQITDFDTMEGGDICISGSGDSKRLSCGITFEGVGEDATADGWGLRIKNASNIEVRNLGFMNCDSNEGDDLGLQQSDDHIWVHNCDFFYGYAGGDADQAKGDGALDTKKSTFVTHSYNHFYDTGKSNLQGMKSESTENYITYHHNWYDHSDSRHPRIRTCSVHIYNNYYDGNAKYGVGVTMGASAFVEGNYYRNCKFPMLISEQGSDVIENWDTLKRNEDYGTFSSENGGIIKSFNNYIEGAQSYVTYQENTKEFDAYEVSAAEQQVPSEVVSYKGGTSYNNFDTSAIMYSYSADAPEVAKEKVQALAGRENGGDFKWDFNDAVDDTDYGVNRELKAALNSYETSLVAVGGGSVDSPSEGASDSSSEGSSEAAGESSSDSGAEASSESAGESSSEAASESSSTEKEPETPVEVTSYVHNFTAQGKVSDFFSIVGNLSTDKGTVIYNDKKLTQCLKIESKTSIKFTAASEGQLTLVFGDKDSSIKLDGDAVKETSNVMTLDIKEGAHELTKKDTENLFYMEYVTKGQSQVEEPSTDEPGNEASGEESSEAAGEASSQESASEASSEAAGEASSQESASESSSEAAGEASSEEVNEPVIEEPGSDPEPVDPEPVQETGTWSTKWGKTTYVFPDGTVATGKQTIDGVTYFFKNNGSLIKQDFVDIDGDRYYADSEGRMVTGWKDKWSARYHFNDEGKMDTGMTTIDGNTYFFKNTGKLVVSNFVTIDGNTYFFNSEGKMVTGEMIRWHHKYVFDENGILIEG
ncbi:pectate lyase family protein [Butyrivibrio sp. INlla14]|uniref:pectate lyase family protein n=1 Tax=Butyrivibrio sp. INlla14 TaxID=1520808 RepID=UPI000876A9E8|nr:hypothetical protein [Butyrivibrio sp. INlla14]SCY65133.1 pectate lyase [Butyrivibrio sp. INlla14]